MRIAVYSDLHVEFAAWHPPRGLQADVVVLAGDIHVGNLSLHWVDDHFPDISVIYVLGNHEFYGLEYHRVVQATREHCRDSNVHFLENDSIQIGDVAFFGATFWTDFELFGAHNKARAMDMAENCMNDYRQIWVSEGHRPLRAPHTAGLHQQSRAWLAEAVSASDAARKVVITHHGPSMESNDQKHRESPLAPAFVSSCEALVDKLAPDLWIHGHTHVCVDYLIGTTRIVSNQRGYIPMEPVAGFDPGLVVTV